VNCLLASGHSGGVENNKLSSLHMLFGSDERHSRTLHQGLLQRQTVQFHWQNQGWPDFDTFLASLAPREAQKNPTRATHVSAMPAWRFAGLWWPISRQRIGLFFYACYERTYLEHGNAPYLTPDFFQRMQTHMSHNWLLFIAEREGRPIASSFDWRSHELNTPKGVAYGRYWGALRAGGLLAL
jgi:predicted N-acyltransferase